MMETLGTSLSMAGVMLNRNRSPLSPANLGNAATLSQQEVNPHLRRDVRNDHGQPANAEYSYQHTLEPGVRRWAKSGERSRVARYTTVCGALGSCRIADSIKTRNFQKGLQ